MITDLKIKAIKKHTWIWQQYQIKYTVMGSGQPLLLIHGFGASIGHWSKNIPVLVEQGYQVWAIDLLGFGGSDKPPIKYSLEIWQKLIVDFTKQHISKPTIFIGNSIGGLLSLMLVANEPDISQGAVLINCAGGLNHRPHELNLPLRLVMGVFTRLVDNPIVGTILFNQIRQKHRIRNTLKQVYRDHTAITDDLVEMLYEPSCDPGAQKVFASILNAPAGPSPGELLPRVKRPLLVLWGEADPWTPIKGASIYQRFAQEGLSIEVIPIPNAGHCPHDECPDQVNPLILNWLNAIY